jgi:GTP-binding protein
MHNIKFIGSFEKINQCPKPDKPEYVFLGRSNVGKSSLINMICNRNSLARVSKQPGKTQEMNYYLVEDTWYLVDLPGYGYAKRSKDVRDKFEKMIHTYLDLRESMLCAFLLVDINVPPQKLDLDIANWMGEHGIPFVIVFTKCDRLKKPEVPAQVFFEALSESWETPPQHFFSSANTNMGREDILALIEEVNASFLNQQ